jgi:hypothetical protein
MLTLWALILLNPVPGVDVPPRDVALLPYRAAVRTRGRCFCAEMARIQVRLP